ncbi:MAG: sugar transferase [Planctomycetota bacterium]
MACPTASESLPAPTIAPTLEPVEVPRGVYQSGGKRALDLAIVLAALPFALLVAAPIAAWNLVVFRDPRRVFFVQDRVGLGGRTFRMVKFRTMKDARRSAADSWFTGEDVARVTRFGRLLRNTHLDELPQLVNILRGDMHLVGPRPEMPDVHEWACGEVQGFDRRLAVRPGLTGLAQVTQGYTGASVECYEQKLGIDVSYIQGLSFRGDLGIVLMTVPWVLRGRGWSWNRGCGASAATPAEAPAIEAPPAAQIADLEAIPAVTPAPALARRERPAPRVAEADAA